MIEREPWRDRWSVAAVALVAGWSVLVGVVHWAAATDGQPHRLSSSVAFALPFMVMAVVACLGLWRGDRGLPVGAGFALVPMVILTFNPLAFPLLLSAARFIVLGLSARGVAFRRQAALGLISGLLAVTALGALLLHDDAAEWETPTGGSAGSSDIATRTEVAISLTLAMTAVLVALAASRRSTSLRRESARS